MRGPTFLSFSWQNRPLTKQTQGLPSMSRGYYILIVVVYCLDQLDHQIPTFLKRSLPMFLHDIAIFVGYPLVNVYITNWNITMLLMGQLTISMAMFNSFLLTFTRG